jgi:hypothetical protein
LWAIEAQVAHLNHMLTLPIHPSSFENVTGYRDALLSGSLNGHGGQYFFVKSGVPLVDSFCNSMAEVCARHEDSSICSYYKIPDKI